MKDNKEELQIIDRLRRGGFWAVLGKAVSVTLGFMASALLARLLPPDEMGLYFLCFSVVSVGAIFCQVGLDRAAVRNVSKSMALGDKALCKKYIFSIVGLFLLVSLVVVGLFNSHLGYFLVVDILDVTLPGIGILWLSIWMVVVGGESIVASVCRGFHDIRLAVLFSGVLRSGFLVVVYFLALFGFLFDTMGIKEILIVSILSSGLSIMIGFFVLRLKILSWPVSSDKPHRRLLISSFPIFLHALLLIVINQSNLWIIGAKANAEDVALYGAAMRLVLLVGVSTSIINAVAPPLISEKHTQGKLHTLEPLLRSATTLCGLPAIFVLLLYMFFAGEVLSIVFGQFYTDAALVLVILSIGELFKVMTGPCSVALNMTGNQVVLLRISLIRVVICILASLIVVEPYGIVGVALVYTLCLIANDTASFLFARQRLGIWTHAGVSGIPDLIKRVV